VVVSLAKKKFKEWYNEFTEVCDSCELDSTASYFGLGTYFWGNEDGVMINENGWVSFRYPGATRGGLRIEDGMIKEISVDESSYTEDSGIACYRPCIREVVGRFLGTKFDLPLVPFD
jgi:hypothetical protein